MNSKTLLAIFSLFCVISFFSCEEDTTIAPMREIVFIDGKAVDKSVIKPIVDSLAKESEYVRASPIIADYQFLPFNFIFGMKDYRPWLNVYDSTWVQIGEHSFSYQVEKGYHVGYGEYSELYDAYLSHIHYDDHVKFLEMILVYKYESGYTTRCQSLFIDNSNFVVVYDSIESNSLESFNSPDDINIFPQGSEEFLKPWVDNSFLYLYHNSRGSSYQYICYNLEDYSVIYKSEPGRDKVEIEIENAINHEEVIMVSGTDSPEIKRYNLKTLETEWSFSIKGSDLMPHDAKCLSLDIVEKRENEWTFAGEWVLFDGAHKKLEFVIDINTGEYLTDNTLS